MPSAQVVSINDRHHLVDCGEGTQMQLLKYRVKFARLDAIFISHLHGDHILGLPGLLNSLSLYERNFPLKLYGPAALKDLLDFIFKQTHSYLCYDLEFYPTEDYAVGDVIYEKDRYQVRLLPLEHRIFCRGYLFQETNKLRKFDFYKAKSLDIPNNYFRLLKQGNTVTLDDGRTILPEQVLMEAEPPMSFAYCSDTGYNEKLVEHIQHARLLYHEATFLHEMKDRAVQTRHSTALEAGKIAQQAAVRELILGHFSARYKDLDPLLQEAQSIFPNTSLAKEGNLYNLRNDVQER
ncbi:UNVERIFIED_CONTAM: hypothetical protein GTU68_047556 [Idotea baltica]|nr:hypothetical protein [Idotea baltica]